jgi:hypothetical protein
LIDNLEESWFYITAEKVPSSTHGFDMIYKLLFFDTSALIKIFKKEVGSENMKWLTSPDTKVIKSLIFFVNDQVCKEFNYKIYQFVQFGEMSKQKADQILDAFNNHYKDKDFKVLPKHSLLDPKKQKTGIEEICEELKLKSGKNDWDGFHFQSIIDSLAHFAAESHPILVTCDRKFAGKVKGKGYRIINPEMQSQKEIEAILS